jgi:sporulation protein YlmC with PRC-barrel domain
MSASPSRTTTNRSGHHRNPASVMLSSSTITGTEVCNRTDEKLGTIHDIMLDTSSGAICYAVLSSGGFLGMGERLFAVPWPALHPDYENRRFILDVSVERLKAAPGFDKENWPDMADSTWSSKVQSYFGDGSPPPPGV